MRMSRVKMAAILLVLVVLAAPALAIASPNNAVLPADLQRAFDSALANAGGVQQLGRANTALNAENAVSPVRPFITNPPVWLEQEVNSGGPATSPPLPGYVKDRFGYRVAVKGDLALVGVPNADLTVNGETLVHGGEVYVFTRANGKWSRAATLTASDPGEQYLFGTGVAISSPDTILIASREANVHGEDNVGAAYVFNKVDGTWTQTQKLLASDGKYYDQFGTSIAVDGNEAVIGASYADPNGNSLAGQAYVFTEAAPGGTWTQAAILTADDGAAHDEFGQSVAISGGTVLVGAFNASVNGFAAQGAAYIFTRSNGSWAQTQKLTEGGSSAGYNDNFGWSVALDGSTAVVGARLVKTVDPSFQTGAAYVYTKQGDAWNLVTRLTRHDPPAVSENFGYSVAVSGNVILASITINLGGANHANNTPGEVFEFKRAVDGTWSQIATIAPSDPGEANGYGQDDDFGYSVSVDSATGTIFVGAPHHNSHAARFGGAYFYDQAELGLTLSAPDMVQAGANYVSQAIVTNSASVASPAVALTVAVPAAASFVSANATSGSCSEDSGVVTCDFGQIDGNAGTATANVTLEAMGSGTILNTASIARTTPPLVASAATAIRGNAPPVASDGSLSTNENTAASDTLKASDPDGDSLIFSVVDQPVHGQVVISDAASGAYTYTPDAGYVGHDVFTFKANDGAVDSNTATIRINIVAASGAPVAKNGTLTTDENTTASGTLQASDPDGDALTFSIVGQPMHGSVTITDTKTGAYNYTPDQGFVGDDAFSFRANDGTANSNTATVSITVKAANQPPVAKNGTLTTDENTAASGTLQASDPDGDALTFSIVTQPNHGSVTLDNAATGAFTYTPDSDYAGNDSFSFKASDGTKDSNTATVSVTVKESNQPPPPDGGGGAMVWFALLALLALAFTGGFARRQHG